MKDSDWIRYALDAQVDGFLVVDKELNIRFVNESYAQIRGVRKEDLWGKPFRDVIKPGRLVPQVINTGKPLMNVYMSSGATEYVVNVVPIVEKGEVIGAVAITKDVTQAREIARRLQSLESAIQGTFRARYCFADMAGNSAAQQKAIGRAKKAAQSDLPVLLRGESGTGKEGMAHAIHDASLRRDHPFVVVDCGTLPDNLVESELFGYAPGTFTGADKRGRIGLLELAQGGTAFLDEIGDLAPGSQRKILRVLQEGTVRPVGSSTEKKLNVRIITATNRPLETMVERGQFREDLYYRLNALPIELPPLRDRKEDIEALAKVFLQRHRPWKEIKFSREAMETLKAYRWPGNIRELQNAVAFAVTNVEPEGELILPGHFPAYLSGDTRASQPIDSSREQALKQSVQLREKERIEALLAAYGSSVAAKRQVAKVLGISLATLYNKVRQYSIGK